MVELQKSHPSDRATSDWNDELKRQDNLRKETSESLRGSDRFELSKYNQTGYYHKVISMEEFKAMKRYWDMEKRVPQEWIIKGNWPGIWTALFKPSNTYSAAHLPIGINEPLRAKARSISTG